MNSACMHNYIHILNPLPPFLG